MILVAADKIDEYTRAGWWGERTLGDLFLDLARTRAAEPAVADPPNRAQITGGQPKRWSYAELLREVGRCSGFFHQQGLKRDDVIVMQLPNCVEMHAVYLACAMSGIVVSPVPVQYRAHELKHVVAGTGARMAITAGRVGPHPAAEHWAQHAGELDGMEAVWAFGDALPAGVRSLDQGLADAPCWSADELQAHARAIGLSAHDVVTICWTSGTEAQPKGVPRNHNEWLIVGISVVEAAQLEQRARLLIPFPFVNMAGVSTSLAAWLLTGGCLHHHHPFDLDVFIDQLRNDPPDYTVAPPAVLSLLLKAPDKLRGVDLSRLKRIGCGGAPLAEWLVEQFAQQFGIEIVNYFGSNEGAALASAPQDIPDRTQRASYFPRFGVDGFDWSASNARKVKTRLVDLESGGDIAEPGRVGELRFAGPTIFSGYYNAPELTARAFDEHGYYRSGDLFEIAGEHQQFYRFAGRHKDIVIRGGMNISSEEVENLILGYPKVREVAVVGWPDPVMGERVCAVVVPQPGQSVALAEIVTYLRDVQQVAAFKLPEKLWTLDALPRNPIGKVLKRDLRTQVAAAAAVE